MGYVSKNLNEGEEILYEAKLHWLIYFNTATILAILCFITSGFVESTVKFALIPFGIIFLIVGIIYAIIAKLSTELAVTNKRVMSKIGFIKRDTSELNHKKVESINVDQGIIDRIFNCGTVSVRGTGSGITGIKNIDDPIKFRNEVNKVLDTL